MRARVVLGSLSLALLTFVAFRAGAQTKTETKAETAKVRDELTTSEQQVARQFDDFVQALLKLKQRLERSPKAEDRERAKTLAAVLDETRNANIALRLERLTAFLKTGKLSNLDEIKTSQTQSAEIADSLNRLLQLMREDPRHKQVQDQRKQLEALIKELDKVIHGQKNVEAQTRIGRTDSRELEANQKRLGEKTAKLAQELDKIMGKGDKAGDPKNLKGENKDAGKGEGKPGESKDVGKSDDPKAGDSKDGGKESQVAKAGAKNDAPGQEKKPGPDGQAKAGGGDPKEKGGKGADGQAKDNKGDQKGGEGSAKAGGDKKGDTPAEAKGSEKQPGDKGPAQAKSGDGEKKDGGAKGSKGEQAKGEPKAGGSKSDGKQGEAKPGSDSKGQAQAKSDGQQSGQQNQGQQAQAKEGGPQQPQPPQPPQGPQPPKDDVAQSKKRIQDGNYEQKQAEKELGKKDNPKAAEHENKAVQHLEDAKAKLEKILRQMREEELERVLAQLQARCEKMLAMQQQVLTGTVAVHKAVEANADKKPKHENKQESIRLSDQEKEIVAEASKAIELLEAEGSAVAFPEVFQQVREDMKHVQRRLELTDVGAVTQTIEGDIIESLKEMIEALKKARQEMENKSGQSPPSQGSPPPDQKLLDQIAELKMIRSLQLRVNARTTTYGRQYEGEQALAPNIRQEIQGLAERQERIFDITNRIAKGENR